MNLAFSFLLFLSVTIFKVGTIDELRSCIDSQDERVCMFTGGGTHTIDEEITIRNPNVTITGRAATKPVLIQSDGSRSGFSPFNIRASNVTLEYMTILSRSSGEGARSVSVANNGQHVTNVTLRHLTTGLSGDEDVIVWYDTTNSQYTDSISALSLGPDSKGPLLGRVGHGGGDFLVARNIFAYHRQRMPRVRSDKTVDIVNNYIFGCTSSSSPSVVSEGSPVNYFGNVFDCAQTYLKVEDSSPVYVDPSNHALHGKFGTGTIDKPNPSTFEFDVLPTVKLGEVLYNSSGNQWRVDCLGLPYKDNDAWTDYILGAIKDGALLTTSDPNYRKAYAVYDDNWCLDRDENGLPDKYESAVGDPSLEHYLYGIKTIPPMPTPVPTSTPMPTPTPKPTALPTPTLTPTPDTDTEVQVILLEIAKLFERLAELLK